MAGAPLRAGAGGPERAVDAAGYRGEGVGEHKEGGGGVRGGEHGGRVRGGVGRGGGAQRRGEPRARQAQGERPPRELLQGQPRDRRVPHLRGLTPSSQIPNTYRGLLAKLPVD